LIGCHTPYTVDFTVERAEKDENRHEVKIIYEPPLPSAMFRKWKYSVFAGEKILYVGNG